MKSPTTFHSAYIHIVGRTLSLKPAKKYSVIYGVLLECLVHRYFHANKMQPLSSFGALCILPLLKAFRKTALLIEIVKIRLLTTSLVKLNLRAADPAVISSSRLDRKFFSGFAESYRTAAMEKILQKKKSQITAQYTSDATAFKYYQQSIQLKIKGKWREAGEKLMMCADLYVHLRMALEAATVYTEAGECYLKMDKSEALRAFTLSIKTYCDVGKFTVAGHLERKVATIHYRIQHYEDAAAHFLKAANFLSGDKKLEQSDYCLEKAAECYIHLGEYAEAHEMYETLARHCVQSNLRRFEARGYLLSAIICLFGTIIATAELEQQRPVSPTVDAPGSFAPEAPLPPPQMVPLSLEQLRLRYLAKYNDILIKNDEYKSIDYLWGNSRHKKLVQNLVHYRRALDLHQFVDHLYYWNNVEAWSETNLILLQNTTAELQLEESMTEAMAMEKQSVVSLDRSIVSDFSASDAGRRSSARESINKATAAAANKIAGGRTGQKK